MSKEPVPPPGMAYRPPPRNIPAPPAPRASPAARAPAAPGLHGRSGSPPHAGSPGINSMHQHPQQQQQGWASRQHPARGSVPGWPQQAVGTSQQWPASPAAFMSPGAGGFGPATQYSAPGTPVQPPRQVQPWLACSIEHCRWNPPDFSLLCSRPLRAHSVACTMIDMSAPMLCRGMHGVAKSPPQQTSAGRRLPSSMAGTGQPSQVGTCSPCCCTTFSTPGGCFTCGLALIAPVHACRPHFTGR